MNARAIQFLATATEYKPEAALTELILQSKDLELVEVLNVAAQLKDAKGFSLKLEMPKEWKKPKKDEVNFFHNNSKYNMIKMRISFLNGDYDS